MNVDGKNYFDSSYKNDFNPKQGIRPQVSKTGRIDNVLVGTDKIDNMYESEAKDQFKNKPAQERV